MSYLSASYLCRWIASLIIGGSYRTTLVVAFGILPKILRGAGELRMVLYNSMNAGWVVETLKSSGDTGVQPAIIKFIWTFCTQAVGTQNHLPCAYSNLARPTSHLVKLSLPNILVKTHPLWIEMKYMNVKINFSEW